MARPGGQRVCAREQTVFEAAEKPDNAGRVPISACVLAVRFRQLENPPKRSL